MCMHTLQSVGSVKRVIWEWTDVVWDTINSACTLKRATIRGYEALSMACRAKPVILV